jgi:hypothetical protein
MPWVCGEGGGTYLTKLDSADLKVTASQFIPDAHVVAWSTLGDQLYLAGETLDRCGFYGKAAVYRLTSTSNKAEPVWKESDLSMSSARGLAIAHGQLLIAIGYRRTLAVQISKGTRVNLGRKRLLDDDASVFDAAIVRLSPEDGRVIERRDLSAGLSILLHGIEMVDGQPIVYGSLGGQPAMTPIAPAAATTAAPAPPSAADSRARGGRARPTAAGAADRAGGR